MRNELHQLIKYRFLPSQSKASTPIPCPSSPISRPSPQPSPQPSSSMVELPSTTTIESTVTTEHMPGQTSPVRSPDNGVSSNMETEEALQDVAQLSRYRKSFFSDLDFAQAFYKHC